MAIKTEVKKQSEKVTKKRQNLKPQNLKNMVFALEGLHFQGFQHLQKNEKKYPKTGPKMSPKSLKK